MEANAFFNSWNNHIDKTAENVLNTNTPTNASATSDRAMEPLNMFNDDLDILLDDIPGTATESDDDSVDSNVIDFDDLLDMVMEEEVQDSDVSISVENNVIQENVNLEESNDALVNIDNTVSDFDKAGYDIQSVSIDCVKNNDISNTDDVKQALFSFCTRYDYSIQDGSFSKIISAIANEDLDEQQAIMLWLNMRWGIYDDGTAFNPDILKFSENQLDNICTVSRNMALSELSTIYLHKDEDYFDASVIKNMSLESRDTGILCQLMCTGKFNREEAVLYLYDVNIFNSYLTLKLTDKFNPESFDSICAKPNSVDVYTSSILNDSPWVFLGEHRDFTKIVKLVSEKEIPLEMAKQFKDSPYLYAILKGYSEGLYDINLIREYLMVESSLNDMVAEDYANCELNKDTLVQFDSNFYLAKLMHCLALFEVKNLKLDSILHDSVIRRDITLYCESLYNSYLNNECTHNDVMCIHRSLVANIDNSFYAEYLKHQQAYGRFLDFNQIWFSILLDKIGINANIPEKIGGLLLIQNKNNISYLNAQIICEKLDTVLDIIKERITDKQVQLLPDNQGLLITNSSYSDFAKEYPRFINYSGCQSSMLVAANTNKFAYMLRYNAVQVLERATNSNFRVSDNFKQLLLLAPENYLVFDNVLNLINIRFVEFTGICTCSEALQCLKLLHAVLVYDSHVKVQIEFLKNFLMLKFGKRIMFENYDSSFMESLNIIEVRNSQHYTSTTFQNVLSDLDNFVVELNKKGHIICKFSAPNKLIIEGV